MRSLRVGFFSADHLHVHAYLECVARHERAVAAGLWHPQPAEGRRVARRHGLQFFPRREDLLAADLDAAIVCSANRDHEPDTRPLAAARVPTLCEKPLGATTAAARAIVRRFARTGTLLMTAFPCRFSPAVLRAREVLGGGELGRVLSAVTTNRGTFPGGWFADRRRAGGGAIIDHTVHVADLLHWLLGCDVATVFAESCRRLQRGAVEDSALLMMTFRDGTAASLDCSWSRPATRYPTWGDLTLELVCERGVLFVDAFAQVVDVFSTRHDRPRHASFGDDLNQRMVDAFLDAVRAGTPPPVTGEDGLRATRVAEAALRSAARGQLVRLATPRAH